MGLCQCNGLIEMDEEAAFVTQCYCNVDAECSLNPQTAFRGRADCLRVTCLDVKV